MKKQQKNQLYILYVLLGGLDLIKGNLYWQHSCTRKDEDVTAIMTLVGFGD